MVISNWGFKTWITVLPFIKKKEEEESQVDERKTR